MLSGYLAFVEVSASSRAFLFFMQSFNKKINHSNKILIFHLLYHVNNEFFVIHPATSLSGIAPAGFKHLVTLLTSQSLLSCFPVLRCILAFPCGTSVYLRCSVFFILITLYTSFLCISIGNMHMFLVYVLCILYTCILCISSV